MPLVLLELWRFVSSGLHTHEKRGVRVFAPFSYLLFLGGIAFSQFVLVPVMLYFLFDFNQETGLGVGFPIESRPRFATIVNLVTTMALVMGLIFQLPLAMLFAQKIGVVSWRVYAGYRRHFIMASLVAAAVLTPTGDPVSLMITMAPVLVLFELGIWLCRASERKAKQQTIEDS
jgi:sec-independent protein translocase protein TatC